MHASYITFSNRTSTILKDDDLIVHQFLILEAHDLFEMLE